MLIEKNSYEFEGHNVRSYYFRAREQPHISDLRYSTQYF